MNYKIVIFKKNFRDGPRCSVPVVVFCFHLLLCSQSTIRVCSTLQMTLLGLALSLSLLALQDLKSYHRLHQIFSSIAIQGRSLLIPELQGKGILTNVVDPSYPWPTLWSEPQSPTAQSLVNAPIRFEKSYNHLWPSGMCPLVNPIDYACWW